jgi:hypothetical protein
MSLKRNATSMRSAKAQKLRDTRRKLEKKKKIEFAGEKNWIQDFS